MDARRLDRRGRASAGGIPERFPAATGLVSRIRVASTGRNLSADETARILVENTERAICR
jgi:hypothetical protein